MHKYQSMVVWQRAHALAAEVLRTTDAAYHPRTRNLFDQIRRAAISVEANIVEGYALGSTPQFKRHLRIAMGSGAEAECLIRLARELDYLDPHAAATLETAVGACLRVLRGLLRAPIPPTAQ